MGFTYNGAKLFNMLPPQMRETKDTSTFKTTVKLDFKELLNKEQINFKELFTDTNSCIP